MFYVYACLCLYVHYGGVPTLEDVIITAAFPTVFYFYLKGHVDIHFCIHRASVFDHLTFFIYLFLAGLFSISIPQFENIFPLGVDVLFIWLHCCSAWLGLDALCVYLFQWFIRFTAGLGVCTLYVSNGRFFCQLSLSPHMSI